MRLMRFAQQMRADEAGAVGDQPAAGRLQRGLQFEGRGEWGQGEIAHDAHLIDSAP